MKIAMVQFFEKANKGQLKILNVTIKNDQISLYW